MFDLVVDVFGRGDLDAMSDAVLLCKAARVYRSVADLGKIAFLSVKTVT